jgi:diphosphomevalonate decarboxylase
VTGPVTAQACANIAFIKYWGRRDHALRLPLNGSISMNLDATRTTTTVEFDPALDTDRVAIQGEPANELAARRVSRHLDRVREMAGITTRACVVSINGFPMGTGIASSASAFAALTLAACAAAGVSLDERALSILARLGSGSACRSIPAGFVEWHAGADSESSYAETIAPPEHWDLRDLIAIVQTEHKDVGSTAGQTLIDTSPFNAARIEAAERGLPVVRRAILECDFETFGEETELEALRMHAVALTTRPSVIYWQPETVRIMQAVRAWRDEGLPAYFTIDAGANVHVLCQGADADAVEERLRAIEGVRQILSNRPGPATHLIDEHLVWPAN